MHFLSIDFNKFTTLTKICWIKGVLEFIKKIELSTHNLIVLPLTSENDKYIMSVFCKHRILWLGKSLYRTIVNCIIELSFLMTCPHKRAEEYKYV